MDLHKAYKKFLKRGKTITDGSCRITIENKKFLIVERIYELDKLTFPVIKRFIPNYVYDGHWEWEENYGTPSTWEVVEEE
jgi:hypothetical protein